MSDNIRYYMGRHAVKILEKFSVDRKVLVRHLETGIIGNETVVRKIVHVGEVDMLYWRCCWRNKK